MNNQLDLMEKLPFPIILLSGITIRGSAGERIVLGEKGKGTCTDPGIFFLNLMFTIGADGVCPCNKCGGGGTWSTRETA